MIKPHFFKVKSRIGIINNPNKQKEENIGVEDGADYILEASFLKNIKSHLVSDFSFPDPKDLSKENFFKTINKYIVDLQNKINREIKDDEAPSLARVLVYPAVEEYENLRPGVPVENDQRPDSETDYRYIEGFERQDDDSK